MSKISKHPAIRMPTVEEDKVITASAKNDPDAKPLTLKQLKSMVPMQALRGRPKSEHKKLLTRIPKLFHRTTPYACASYPEVMLANLTRLPIPECYRNA